MNSISKSVYPISFSEFVNTFMLNKKQKYIGQYDVSEQYET